MKKQTVAQLLKHDFSKGGLYLYDSNGKLIYYEHSDGFYEKKEYDNNGNITYYECSNGFWFKRDYDVNGNLIYGEQSNGFWFKRDYDVNGNEIYFENSKGEIVHNRPKKKSCNGKVVEIDGKQYRLTEI